MRTALLVLLVLLVPCVTALEITPSVSDVNLVLGESKKITLLSDEIIEGEVSIAVCENLKDIIRITKHDDMNFELHAIPHKSIQKGTYEGTVYFLVEQEGVLSSTEFELPVRIKIQAPNGITGYAVTLDNEVGPQTYTPLSGDIIFLCMILAALVTILFTSYRKMKLKKYYRS